MPRYALVVTILLVVAATMGCSNLVPLSQGRYAPLSDTVEVQVIDARDMTRERLERVLNEHEMIARFDARPRSGGDVESELADALEKGKRKAREAGGSVLLYTDDSELIATIVRDARFAGAPDAVTMYVLRRRGG
jgi:hypothetical protein